MDNRRVGLMMGIPQKEDLVRAQKNVMVKDAEQKSMHSTMIELWVTSIEYARGVPEGFCALPRKQSKAGT
jgi:hypothetical protein